jgi:hypothetical protein
MFVLLLIIIPQTNNGMVMKVKYKETDDIIALRAFVLPEMFPFLLEVYTKQGRTESSLIEDIKKARECYKQLVSLEKKKVLSSSSNNNDNPTLIYP